MPSGPVHDNDRALVHIFKIGLKYKMSMQMLTEFFLMIGEYPASDLLGRQRYKKSTLKT